MSKTKENPEIDFQLVKIEPVGFSMDLPEGIKVSADFQFRIFLESYINAEKKKLVVSNTVDIRAGSDTPVLATMSTKFHFDITGLDHIKKNKKGQHIVPPAIQLAVNTIALSTTRGLLFSQFKGTPLHNAILPLIDPADFSVNEVES